MRPDLKVLNLPDIPIGTLFFYEQYGLPVSLCIRAFRGEDAAKSSADHLVILPNGKNPEWECAAHELSNFRGTGVVVDSTRLIIDPTSLSSSRAHGLIHNKGYVIVAGEDALITLNNGRYTWGYVSLSSGKIVNEIAIPSAAFSRWRIERGDPAEIIFESQTEVGEHND